MAKVGGELQQMEQLKKTFMDNVQRAQELQNQIDGRLNDTYWEGPAAERFKAAWNNEFKSALGKLREALTEAANEVDRRRKAIEQATS